MSAKMRFNDDERIVSTKKDVSASGKKPAPFRCGEIQTTIINQSEAPVTKTRFKVMLEITGAESGKERAGVDLVMILDVNQSMKGEKLVQLKKAVQFVIGKLKPIDRLSVVGFGNGGSVRLCPLRQMTQSSRTEIETRVNGLVAGGSVSIGAGLQTGLKVLSDRNSSRGRVAAVVIMSQCEFDSDSEAALAPVGDLPVYTFCFGNDYNPKVLKAIADNSMGGTFTVVKKQDYLSAAFSKCWAGILTVVVSSLKLVVTKIGSKILKVSAGNYPQSAYPGDSVTVRFGDLFNKELHVVVVDLLLPSVQSPASVDVLKITSSYLTAGDRKPFECSPIFVTIARVDKPVSLVEKINFKDDEPIVAVQKDVSGEKHAEFIVGKVKLTVIKKTEAPFKETKKTMSLELTGAGSGNNRAGVDIVMVLDISERMNRQKIDKMKKAVYFVIKKLSPIDRLSVVTSAENSNRLCPLRQITENSQMQIQKLVMELKPGDGTDITVGLQTALRVLRDRDLTSGRVPTIMLMSHREHDTGGEGAPGFFGKVPVYTFDFGTSPDTQNQANLSVVFSECLSALLTVAVKDVKLTITRKELAFEKVFAGSYPQSRDDGTGSVTVSFGDLYNKEVRKVIVDFERPN